MERKMSDTYKRITEFILKIEDGSYGKWMPEFQTGDGTLENPYQMPYVEYRREIADLEQVIYQFVDEHPEYGLNNYMDILQCYQIEWGVDSMSEADISHMDGRGIMALLVGAIRAERFSEGTLLNFLQRGCIQKWLKRLEELDQK
ncbi:MAG: DUF6508 domain-containing protein [Firmicutes bacterium]|nr:DUF6508 domain-containing protein [Bacillota bacterium]